MNIIYYDSYHTVIRNRDEKEDDEEHDNVNIYLWDDIIMANYGIGIKPRETIVS